MHGENANPKIGPFEVVPEMPTFLQPISGVNDAQSTAIRKLSWQMPPDVVFLTSSQRYNHQR